MRLSEMIGSQLEKLRSEPPTGSTKHRAIRLLNYSFYKLLYDHSHPAGAAGLWTIIRGGESAQTLPGATPMCGN